LLAIISVYDKSKNQNKQKQGGAKPPVVVQEEKKSAILDDDDDEDEFKALRKAPSKAETDDGDLKSIDGGKDKNIKNIQKVPRGKRAKIQKIKEKYADQDEEERELRFKLTGVKDFHDEFINPPRRQKKSKN